MIFRDLYPYISGIVVIEGKNGKYKIFLNKENIPNHYKKYEVLQLEGHDLSVVDDESLTAVRIYINGLV